LIGRSRQQRSWRTKQAKGSARPTLQSLASIAHLLYNFFIARSARPPLETKMRASDGTVTSSRFERRLPGGQHKPAFRVAFGSYSAAARALHVSRTTIWRWCNDPSSLPRYVAEILADVVQDKISDAHAAKNHVRDFLAQPPKPPRHLSGACAGYSRKRRLKGLSSILFDG
jgi:hypothetical protein